MRVLAIGIGADTQEILLFDTATPVQNHVKMVMPSATEIAARRIRRATAERRPVLLTGVTMGSGPCHFALEAHLRDGLRAFATEQAARTFDPDLTVVRAKGVTVLSDDEAATLRGAERVVMRDLDLVAIRSALAAFEAPTGFDGLALGCLDHGTPPPGVSERVFRFEHLRHVVQGRNDLRAFALAPEDVPDYLTRARSMLSSRDIDVPTVYVDTGVAAALGALRDPHVRRHDSHLILNVGSTHTLAMRTSGARIHAFYEHHTERLSGDQIEDLTVRLVSGALTNEEVVSRHGHGAWYVERHPEGEPFVAVTGLRRGKLRGRRMASYVPVAYGDALMAGSVGLIDAFAARYPDAGEEIEAAFAR